MRLKLLRYIVRKFDNKQPYEMPSDWVMKIYAVLFPFRAMYERNTHAFFDVMTGDYIIDGVRINNYLIVHLKMGGKIEFTR